MTIDSALELMDFNFVGVEVCDNYFGAERKNGEIGIPRGPGNYRVGSSDNWFIKYDKSMPLTKWILENILPQVFKISEKTNPETLNHDQLYGKDPKDNIILWTKKEIPESYKGAAEEFHKQMHFMIPGDNEFTKEYAKKFGADMDKIDY